jgi:hypothetical protein
LEPDARLAADNSVNQTSAQRSRELGYADAMREVWNIVRELEKAPLPAPDSIEMLEPEMAFYIGVLAADQQLKMLGIYAFDAYYLHLEPGKDTTRHVDRLVRYPTSFPAARPELPA